MTSKDSEDLAARGAALAGAWFQTVVQMTPDTVKFQEQLTVLQIAASDVLSVYAFNFELNPDNKMSAEQYLDDLLRMLKQDVQYHREQYQKGLMHKFTTPQDLSDA